MLWLSQVTAFEEKAYHNVKKIQDTKQKNIFISLFRSPPQDLNQQKKLKLRGTGGSSKREVKQTWRENGPPGQLHQ